MEDVFRKNYSALSEVQKREINVLVSAAEELYKVIDADCEHFKFDARCLALAKTKLEECVMWAKKGMTK